MALLVVHSIPDIIYCLPNNSNYYIPLNIIWVGKICIALSFLNSYSMYGFIAYNINLGAFSFLLSTFYGIRGSPRKNLLQSILRYSGDGSGGDIGLE